MYMTCMIFGVLVIFCFFIEKFKINSYKKRYDVVVLCFFWYDPVNVILF